MRFNATLLAGLACMQLSIVHAPIWAAPNAWFCGSAPAGWTPPWQRKPVQQDGASCHLIACERRKPGNGQPDCRC